VQERELEQQLRRRRHLQLLMAERRQEPQVLFERLQDVVRIELKFANDLREHLPFNLRKSKEEVFVVEQRMFAAQCLFYSAVDHSLCGFAHFALRYFQFIYHDDPPSNGSEWSKRRAKMKLQADSKEAERGERYLGRVSETKYVRRTSGCAAAHLKGPP